MGQCVLSSSSREEGFMLSVYAGAEGEAVLQQPGNQDITGPGQERNPFAKNLE